MIEERVYTVKTWQDVLRGAVRVIEERGWIQHAFQDVDGVCMIGAVRLVGGATPIWQGPGDHLPLLIAEAQYQLNAWLDDQGYPTAIKYNDTEGRTRDEVLHVLRAAAATPVKVE